MEDISPIYDNISIRDWADNLLDIKIRELDELIDNKSNELKTLNVQARLQPMNKELRTDITQRFVEFTLLMKRRNVLKTHRMQHEYIH
jgi:hypothetical protein